MQHSKRLQPVANIAKQNERTSARQHGERLRELAQQQKQLDELVEYREQYIENFHTACCEGLSIVQVRDYQLFITRLDEAIEQQKQRLFNEQQISEQAQATWKDKRSRSEMIDKVVENRKYAEKQQDEKLQQKETDDLPHGSSQG